MIKEEDDHWLLLCTKSTLLSSPFLNGSLITLPRFIRCGRHGWNQSVSWCVRHSWDLRVLNLSNKAFKLRLRMKYCWNMGRTWTWIGDSVRCGACWSLWWWNLFYGDYVPKRRMIMWPIWIAWPSVILLWRHQLKMIGIFPYPKSWFGDGITVWSWSTGGSGTMLCSFGLWTKKNIHFWNLKNRAYYFGSDEVTIHAVYIRRRRSTKSFFRI